MDDEQDAIMRQALDALKLLAPDLPVLCVIAFPTESDDTALICSGGNMSQAQQALILAMALDAVKTPEPDSTLH
jgi:hypothetical protein